MATIQKRDGARGVTYRVRVKMQGQVRSRTFKRLTDARAWAADAESDLGKGKHVPRAADRRRTVADVIDRYLTDTLPTKRKSKDQANPIRHLAWWREQIGRVPLVDLGPDEIVRGRDKLAKGKTRTGQRRAPGTVNRYVVSLSHALSVAVKQWRWLPDNPARFVENLAEPDGRDRFLSEAERAALLKACKADTNPDIYDMVILALSTALRASELTGLQWKDVTLEHQRLRALDTRNGESRVVPVKGPWTCLG